MTARAKTFHLAALLAGAASLIFSQTVCAYEVALTPAAIHDAFVLGQRNDQATAAFLNPYLKQLQEESAPGPHIAEIDILTPFAQVVDDSRKQLSGGYTEPKAAEAYQRRGDKIIVRILLTLPAAYPKADQNAPAAPTPPGQRPNEALRPENFWQNFRFSAKQHGKLIPSRSIKNTPIYSSATKDAPSVLDGANLILEYDAKDVASDETVVEVVTPEAKTASATFDLKKLR